MSAADDVRRSKGPIDSVRVAYAGPVPYGRKRGELAKVIERTEAAIIEQVRKSPGITLGGLRWAIPIKTELVKDALTKMVMDGRLTVVQHPPRSQSREVGRFGHGRGYRLGPAMSDNLK